jgi:hypothetical protein
MIDIVRNDSEHEGERNDYTKCMSREDGSSRERALGESRQESRRRWFT